MEKLENKFSDIPVEYRPVPFWSWNDLLEKDELKRQIKEYAKQGIGGVFMHPRVGLLTKINSPEWFDMINFAVKTAKEEGLQPWLYDEDRWPSGFGCGEVTAIEEYRMRALVLLSPDELTENDTVYAEHIQNGTKYVIARRIAPIGDPWFNGYSYVDLMNPKAVRKFLDCMHERYKENCGKDFGTTIPGIFTDEPCYLMNNAFNVPVVPWSDCLADFFKNRHGYDVTEHLAELFFPVGDYHKTRFDFYDSASALLLESFTKQYYDWCDKNNLKLVGHFMAEDNMHYQTQWVGNVMPHYEFMHYPGIDKLGRHIDREITVKQVSSAAEQLGKERTLSEVYGCIGQQCGFKERKWIADWQAVHGINFVNPHLSLYSMRGERKRDYPSNLFYPQPWWEDERQFADYISRLSMASAFGKRETDILVIHAIGSCWSVFDPTDRVPGHSTVYDPPFNKLTARLIEENLDFHFGDETLMQKYARVENGKLIVGNCAYSTVVVPPSMTLRASTCKLLNEFAKQSPGRLIYIHPYPYRVDGAKVDFVFADGCIKERGVEDAIGQLKKLTPNRVLTTDAITGKNAARVICCSKNDGKTRLVLFANSEQEREVNAVLSVADERTPYMLDLSSGKIHEVPYKTESGRTLVKTRLYAAGSLALVFSDEPIDALPSVCCTQTGAQFTLNTTNVISADILKTEIPAQNALPINHVTLYINGELAAENAPLASLWKDYFYAQKDGTPFAAEYKFTVGQVPEGEVFAAIECAHNLDSITLNGEPIHPLRSHGDPEVYDPDVTWLDLSFIKVPLSGVRTGENVIRISGKKVNNTNGAGGHNIISDFNNYHCTELEAIYIVGDFAVSQRDKTDFWITRRQEPDYKNITDSGYPFYPGKVYVTAHADYNGDAKQVLLRINDASCCDARIFVNGHEAEMRYMKPFICDITGLIKPGSNDIRIELAGTLFNLMGPNWIDNVLIDTYSGPDRFINMAHYTDQYVLLPYGLGGIDLIY